MDHHDHDAQGQLEQAAILGELARSLVHDFNNFLNTLLLQVAVMETGAPEGLRADLALLRQEGKKMASLIQAWQRLRRPAAGAGRSVDVNRVVAEVARDLGGAAGVELAAGPLLVAGSALEVRCLCLFLMGSLADEKGRATRVRTAATPPGASLSVWRPASAAATQASGLSSLELDACKSLAERLRGRLTVEKQPDGDTLVTFEAPLAAS